MSKRSLTKEIQKELREIADKMPIVFYTVPTSEPYTGKELKLTAIQEDSKGRPLEDDQIYMVKSQMDIASNHYRRMKKAYLKDGAAGVKAYCEKVWQLYEKSKQSLSK